MPRSKPLRCHTCGTLYTGGRCPKCYPKRGKKQGAGGGHGGGGRRGRWTAAQVLGRGVLPVNVDCVDGLDDVDEGAYGVHVERPTDGACTTEPELQVQEWDKEGEARSSEAPPGDEDD